MQFEILYMQKGTWQPPIDSAHQDLYKLELAYIEVPLIFQHKFHIQVRSVSTDRFAFEFGPSIGALVHIEQNGLYYRDGTYISGYFNDGDYKKTDISLNAGINYNFFNNFMFNVRYSNSIIPITKNKDVFGNFFRYTFNKGDNMVFSFSLRYLFGQPATTE